MADEIPVLEGEGSSAAEVASAQVNGEEEAPRRAIAVNDADRRRNKVNVHWKRPKSHLYEYNYDYGSNYYRGMIDYLNERSSGYKPEPPKPQTWAERALKTYTERRQTAARTKTNADVELLHKLRSSAHVYEAHAKTYSRKFSSTTY